ncbi:unnamed protein product [Darwinula stevensoni]|uniref:Uncharacterized protein n=1 Tax=Darwinula stevensoni TaxID=69355 RepID=A0A7R8X7R5_9CRUS|nr:unnamed protein product [Darwinula stevensoni]CAG0889390.1 unnamed protein product [Darwinula stevensoni]
MRDISRSPLSPCRSVSSGSPLPAPPRDRIHMQVFRGQGEQSDAPLCAGQGGGEAEDTSAVEMSSRNNVSVIYVSGQDSSPPQNRTVMNVSGDDSVFYEYVPMDGSPSDAGKVSSPHASNLTPRTARAMAEKAVFSTIQQALEKVTQQSQSRRNGTGTDSVFSTASSGLSDQATASVKSKGRLSTPSFYGKHDFNRSSASPWSGSNSSTLQLLRRNHPSASLIHDDMGGGWPSKFHAFMVSLALIFGLGNLWILPGLVFEYGGGTFILVFLLIWVLICLPLYLLESALGQFSGRGFTSSWKCVQLLKGVGVAQFLCCIYAGVLYLPVVATGWMYLIDGMDILGKFDSPDKRAWTFPAGVLVSVLIVCVCLSMGFRKCSHFLSFLACITGCLFVLQFSFGIYIDATYNFKGLQHLVDFHWKRLEEPKLWYEASVQVLLSMSLGFGLLTSLAKNNGFRTDVWTHSAVMSVVGLMIALMSILTTFGHLGGLESVYNTNLFPDREMDLSGDAEALIRELRFGLPFIVFSGSVGITPNTIRVPSEVQLVMTMLLLIFSGLCSLILLVNGMSESLAEEVHKNLRRRSLMMFLVITLITMFAITYLAVGGYNFYTCMESLILNLGLSSTVVIGVFTLVHAYGVSKLKTDIEFMLYKEILGIYGIWWSFLLPLVLLVTLGSGLYAHGSKINLNEVSSWVIPIGYSGAALPIFFTCLLAVRSLIKQIDYGIRAKLKAALKPASDWGPQDPIVRHNWMKWKAQSAGNTGTTSSSIYG